MKSTRNLMLAALLSAGAAIGFSAPANADVDVGISFGLGLPGFSTMDPCDYYSYYYEAPPWGLPPDYCAYRVYYDPVYWGGNWYHGPIYYRMRGGRREFWLNGGWHYNDWHRSYRPRIDWHARGRGWRNDWRERHDRWAHSHRGVRHEMRHDMRSLERSVFGHGHERSDHEHGRHAETHHGDHGHGSHDSHHQDEHRGHSTHNAEGHGHHKADHNGGHKADHKGDRHDHDHHR